MNKILLVVLAIILVATSAFRTRVTAVTVTEQMYNYYTSNFTEEQVKKACPSSSSGTVKIGTKTVNCEEVWAVIAKDKELAAQQQ